MTYSETYILSSDQVYTKLYTCILYQYDINLHNFQDIMILCNFVQVNHDLLNLFHHPVMKCSPLFKSLPLFLDLIQLNTSLSHSFIPFKKTSSNPSWKSGISAHWEQKDNEQASPPTPPQGVCHVHPQRILKYLPVLTISQLYHAPLYFLIFISKFHLY